MGGICSSNSSKACYLAQNPLDNKDDRDDELVTFTVPTDHINDFDWDNDITVNVKPQRQGIFSYQGPMPNSNPGYMGQNPAYFNANPPVLPFQKVAGPNQNLPQNPNPYQNVAVPNQNLPQNSNPYQNVGNPNPVPCFVPLPVAFSIRVKDRNHHHHDSFPIDIICVVDHSGSMAGEKIDFLKSALKDVIDLLHEDDRICIVEFDNRVNRVIPLVRANKANKKRINQLIDQIEANGGTDINLGMRKAFNIIKNRRYHNPITGIFLLSDGLDEGADVRIAQSLSEFNIPDFFTIDSFGLGHEHCPKLMSNIAKLEDGGYYNIEEFHEVDECFVDAMAGLLSVVAVNVIMQVEQTGQIQMQKGYGDCWQQANNGNTCNVIQVNNLISGSNKDFMADFVFDYNANANQTPEIKVKFQATIPGTSKIIYKEKTIILPPFYDLNKYQALEEDPEIMENMHRVKAAEAILKCYDLKKGKNHDKALDNIKLLIDDIKSCPKSDQSKLKHLLNDLQECMNVLQMHDSQIEKKKHKLFEKSHAHLNQKSHGEAHNDAHSNSLQKKLVLAIRQKKGL